MAAHAHACIDPAHHVHDAAGFVGAVERACRERGLRLTPIRARVLGLIADAGRPLKAYDLLDQVREGEGPGRCTADGISRARFPARNGFITSWQSVNASSPATTRTPRSHSVPFLICDRCHTRSNSRTGHVVAALDARARALGFEPQAQTL